ncbi:hypothetical protein V1478_009211 [Vespula squamosa]|uniref:Uncharacterized protein n=1 Tax=Vespula squamosa TaxID=30214 RepID=A0ABD2ANZ6_VESSQ
MTLLVVLLKVYRFPFFKDSSFINTKYIAKSKQHCLYSALLFEYNKNITAGIKSNVDINNPSYTGGSSGGVDKAQHLKE